MSQPPARQVAAAVVQRADGQLLLLKRSMSHTTYPGLWCVVTGYIEPGETPAQAAARELQEELGISAAPVRGGSLVIVERPGAAALHVHPFLFRPDDFEVRLDREHIDYRWIEAAEVYGFECVPQLDEDFIGLGLLNPRPSAK